MSNYPDPKSTFLVIGDIAFDPNVGPTHVRISVRDGEKLYLDVICFEDGPIAEFRNLRKGMPVKVAGVLGKKKTQVLDARGRATYETTLVARKVLILNAGLRQPAPQPMYQPANPPGAPAMTYPQWAAQQGPQTSNAAQMGIYQQQPQQQAAPSHPASWDIDDKIGF